MVEDVTWHLRASEAGKINEAALLLIVDRQQPEHLPAPLVDDVSLLPLQLLPQPSTATLGFADGSSRFLHLNEHGFAKLS
jgi:hypothetical protein